MRIALRRGKRFPLAAAFGIYTVAFLAAGLAVAVRLRRDALGRRFAVLSRSSRSWPARSRTGQSPFWTPNIFAGWPQIADPQSLIFSPLHLLVALIDPSPSPRLFDALTFGLLYIGGAGVILLFRDRGWHVAARWSRRWRFQLRRLGSLAHPAHRADREPGIPAARAVDAVARTGALVVAGRRSRRPVRLVYRARARPGGAGRSLCADRLRVVALA